MGFIFVNIHNIDKIFTLVYTQFMMEKMGKPLRVIKVINKTLIWLLLSVFLIMLVFVTWSIPKLQTTHYTIDSPKLDAEVKLVVISDLHSSNFGDKQEQLISEIKKQSPDLILMTGDIIDATKSVEPVKFLLNGIKNICPIYYIYGNHEQHAARKPNAKALLETYGVKIMEEVYAEENINGQKIHICGLRDPQDKVAPDTWQKGLSFLSDQVQEDAYTILLSHRPTFVDYYKQTNFDLIVCGHAHGGQWRIPFINKGIYTSDEGFFPKYYQGLHDLGRQKMIISRGLALEDIPRFNNRPELVVITLK